MGPASGRDFLGKGTPFGHYEGGLVVLMDAGLPAKEALGARHICAGRRDEEMGPLLFLEVADHKGNAQIASQGLARVADQVLLRAHHTTEPGSHNVLQVEASNDSRLGPASGTLLALKAEGDVVLVGCLGPDQ